MQAPKFDFKEEVVTASNRLPIVADFWAEWCAPCRMLGPVLEKLAAEAKGKWKLVKVNTEQHPELSAEYGIRGIPAVKMFNEGKEIAEFVGALPEMQIRKWLEQHLPSESKKLLEAARAALTTGDQAIAQELLKDALVADETNHEARIMLAELTFGDDNEAAAKLIENTPEEHPLYTRAAAITTLNRLLTAQKQIVAETESSKAAQSYLAGVESLRQKRYESAITQWIEAIMLDKKIDDDGPRKACIALFSLLGHDHEITQKHHRAFTSALF